MSEKKEEKKELFCPYCDEEMVVGEFLYCHACQVKVFYCPECRKPLSRENRTCPHCGAIIRG